MKARDAVVAALLKIQEQGGYSNIVLDEMLEHTAMADADRAFAARLLYGVTERRLTLDYLLNKTSSTPVKQMDSAVREILRVGAYQLVYMDKIPSFAAINEAVGQTRAFGCGRLSGFVNGVLRQVERRCDELLADLPQTDKGLEIRYSVPRSWIRVWREAYGDDVLQGILNSINEAPPSYIRVNTCVTTTQEFCKVLDTAGIGYATVPGLPDALCVDAIHTLPNDFANHYYFQDLASQWSCLALDAQPGERIADMCAAPGGKTMTVAQYMYNDGAIVASDLHEHKCRGMTQRVARYGLICISIRQRDASQPPEAEEIGAYDRVICDVPCSGLGVIRRKPEIRYKSPEDFADLPGLQLQILQQGAKMVKPGGVLQYSTCTLRPEENEMVAAAFLEQNADFAPRLLPLPVCFEQSGLPISHQITLFPHIHGADGFYIAGFVKKT